MPRLSIVIATQGREHQLVRVLASLRHQTAKDFDIHVAGDGCPPRIKSIVESKSRQIRCHFHWTRGPSSIPMGAAAARNAAARHCDAARILIVDDDCVCPPGLVEAHANFSAARVAVIGYRLHVAEAGHRNLSIKCLPEEIAALPTRAEQRMEAKHREQLRKYIEAGSAEVQGFAYTCHLSLPQGDLVASGGWWEAFTASGCEDCELALRLHRMGVKFTVLESPQVLHLDHPKCSRQSADYFANRKLYFRTKGDANVTVRNGGPLCLASNS